MNRSLVLFVLCFLSTLSFADIIPADRRTDWTPGTSVGVPGGIPNRQTIGANVKSPPFNAIGDGVADDTAAIQAALAACPAGQVLIIPAGTYNIVGRINATKSEVTWRGAGLGLTTLKMRNANPMYCGNGDWPVTAPTLAVTAGATRGSKVLTLADSSSVTVGKLVTLTQLNPAHVHSSTGYSVGPADDGHDLTRLMAITARVTAKTATTITLEHPLPTDMTNSPMLTLWRYLVTGTGFEDLTFDMTDSTAISALTLTQVYGCWINGVEVKQAGRRQLWLAEAINCEIRRCYTHDARGAGPNHEGIDLVQNCCFNLVEDNICSRGGGPMIILGDWGGGCANNVIAHNFVDDELGGGGYAGMAICDSHGAHNMFNLFEGNVTQNLAADGYYGSAECGTFFRNFVSGFYSPINFTTNQVPIGLMLNRWATRYNVLGNVLGVAGNPQAAVYDQQAPGYSALLPAVLRFGYPAYHTNYASSAANPSGTTTNVRDTDVRSTVLLHGNFDHVQNKISWDAGIPDHALPASLYLSAKPAWFGEIPWPAIGPDRTPMSGQIPAQARFAAMKAPASVTLTPTIKVAGTAVTINGALVPSGMNSAPIPLLSGTTVITVIVAP